jgi:hypothetical protein
MLCGPLMILTITVHLKLSDRAELQYKPFLIMGKLYDEITKDLEAWIEKQEMFWVASAPLTADGHINVSPKGHAGSFHIVNSHKVWYEDCTGSGEFTLCACKYVSQFNSAFQV